MWSSRSQPPRQARGARATPARAPGTASRTRCRGPAGPEGWPKTVPTVLRRRQKVVAPRPLRPDDSQRLQCRNARRGESGRRVCACVRAMSASGPKPSWAAVGAAAARRRLWRQSESIHVYVSTRSGGACIEGLCGSRTVGARCCDEVRLELRGQVLRDLLKVTERVVQQRMQPSQRDAACARSRLDGVADRSRRLGDERAARDSAERVPQQKHELHVW